MERRLVNPWTWQEQFGYEQAVEVSGAERTLYCAGQTSVDDEGNPMHEGDMTAQVLRAPLERGHPRGGRSARRDGEAGRGDGRLMS